jgi:aconitate hydratase
MAPTGAIVVADRSSIEAFAEYTFMEDRGFVQRAKAWDAGENHGQGSSREHAALAPAPPGIWAMLAQGFARIHRRKLIARGLVSLGIGPEARRRLRPR